ncbi:hypothetical protein [Couchioplanes caeruleus]|uniref:Uncharacterized protein n=2 Tax=Couchioplanes caeruleus TaxID=56438 RepID=A0A1K0FJW1_9ACTN|nr:hypothetical protein [Couchioplanes caeruleus]OJF13113.1 hypothetical protein BG844_17030 [Couchioplanes caeruleus subsp. caeruleus]ROP28219.1 hypothetical protein EDD30_0946 [Couchioplanes caeruleus]
MLVHRRKSPAPGIRKTLYGLVPLIIAVVSFVALLRAGGDGALQIGAIVLLLASGMLLAYRGAWWLVDGITDLIAWWAVHRGPPTAMRLSAWGVEYAPSWRGGEFPMSVPWSEVTATTFRPGLGRTPVFCVDADGQYPAPPADRLHHLSPRPLSGRALAWADAQAPASDAERTMLTNTYLFGTPMVINLKLCDGMDVDEMDRRLQDWTGGRCRCRPPTDSR